MATCTNAIAFAQEQNYEELIRFLDEGNYDAAHEYIDKLEETGIPQESETDITESDLSQTPPNKDIMEIELTPDNFMDYFDIVFSDTATFMDAFDEEVSNYSNNFIFVNKAYNDGLVFLGTSADFAIEIDFQYLEGIQEGNLDVKFNGNALRAPNETVLTTLTARISPSQIFQYCVLKGQSSLQKKRQLNILNASKIFLQ